MGHEKGFFGSRYAGAVVESCPSRGLLVAYDAFPNDEPAWEPLKFARPCVERETCAAGSVPLQLGAAYSGLFGALAMHLLVSRLSDLA